MTHCIANNLAEHHHLIAGLKQFCARQRFVCLQSCVQRLTMLIANKPLRPVIEYEAAIRHIVAEHCAVHEAGDAMPLDLHHMAFDVRDLVDEMENLRLAFIDQTTHQTTPLTPLMAG